jgi:hypothetical protein
MVKDHPQLLKSPLCHVCMNRIYKEIFGRDLLEEKVIEKANDFKNNRSKRNWGGHMINPPEECEHRFQSFDGGIWVDLGICNRSCKRQCLRLMEWKRMRKNTRLKELYENGVIYA